MATCPYCKSEVDIDISPPRMTLKQDKVFQDILKAGPDGLRSDDLVSAYFNKRNPITVRTCIYNINKVITPLKIITRGGAYFLTKQD